MRPTCLLLDLDGTLVDSAPGVTAGAAAALRGVGAAVPDEHTLRSFVGPPMYESFRRVVGLDEASAALALRAYRAHYAEHGLLDSALFPGIPETLDALAAAGLPMAVATSKVEDQALRLVRHYGLDTRLEAVCGICDQDGRTTKQQVIRACLERLRELGVDTSRPLMVGDRSYDVTSAAAEGVPAVHVLWGYGGTSESEGAIASVAAPAGLVELLTGVTAGQVN
ncbi:HAD hydrolase-like protein [Streptomyces sp. NPDC020996]|uniref:HAD hydrolase-like protein n=1 Tax=Streptomyces sp. NPDC020996 TaxID=3154791 RepID=UPI0033E6D7BA